MQTEGFNDALGASYRLVEKQGQGATGAVWQAIDRRTDEVVAAKLLREEHTADQDLVGRFIRERSILTGLRHPNVVAVRDLVVEGSRLAIIMDFVSGGSLRDVLHRSGPLEPARAVDVTAEVLDGLAAAHAKGVLHRDIKPDNVLLASDWESLGPGDVKLTDFGISRLVAERPGTTTGLLGTPEYMSPELLVTGSADLPADVYGIGILLYELLAGRTPFAGPGTDYTIAHRHVTNEPPKLAVPDDLWSVISTLLHKDPSTRPKAAEAAAALRRIRPALTDLPALEAQAAPAGFDSARGPATIVRGIAPAEEAAPSSEEVGDGVPPDDRDLGTPGQQTIVRPMARPKPTGEAPAPVGGRRVRETGRPKWRDPRAIGLVAAALVLLAGAVAFALTAGGGGGKEEPAGGGTPVRATQQDPPVATGLTVSRTALYDPETESVELTVTYAAQNAPLTGPFLEVIPGTGSECPAVAWEGTDQRANLPSSTGVTTECAWSIEAGTVPEQEITTVTAQVPLSFGGADPNSALQEWLDDAAARTTAAVTDSQITSTAYPAQRLQDVQVVAPDQIVSGRTLSISLLPVWPSGPDQLHPLDRSPAIGEPSSMLTAGAGGEEGVRFSDGCSGALAVSGGGLVVTALNVAVECSVLADVGNFTDRASNPINIVTRSG